MSQFLSKKDNMDILIQKVSCETCSISQLCLPNSLSREEVSRLNTIVSRGTPIQKGKFLSQAGDNFKQLFAVSSGSFKSYTLSEDGIINITGFFFPGELIGLDAISTGSHTSFVKALETSAVCALPFEKLEDLSGDIRNLRKQMLRVMSKEIMDDQELLLLLSRKNAAERMAAFLLSLSLRFKQRGFSSTSFNLTMTRSDIGNYLGLAIETVSRLFSQFQKKEIICVSDKLVEIIDLDALMELAGTNSDKCV
ncbi:MAG: fumarate/nitrate reduction transcriptional regulator Fnr [Gammaproteobacteria bacterium]|nr:fumarate/nitrate reduction transcriptional regulator Fnr [Gammaproteobacteria bacterium]